VFVTDPVTGDDWPQVRAELTEAFLLSQRAARQGWPVVFAVDGDDLLGRNGPGRAMVACGLLSAARTFAMENRKAGIPVNVLALEPTTEPATVASWVELLLRPGGPQGELVRLGGDHLGKALP
jgi:hypothetical protein